MCNLRFLTFLVAGYRQVEKRHRCPHGCFQPFEFVCAKNTHIDHNDLATTSHGSVDQRDVDDQLASLTHPRFIGDVLNDRNQVSGASRRDERHICH